MAAGRVCKDCRAEEVAGLKPLGPDRPAPHPGPRCATHHRLARKAVLEAKQERNRQARYGITPEEYARLFEHQGRRCAICRRATGASRRLAVDHDHRLGLGHHHEPTQACSRCLRGLLCGPCNSMLAHARDEPALFHRAVRYLAEWPATTAGI